MITTTGEKDAVRARRNRLERVAAAIADGDDPQLERLIGLVDELGAARRLVQRSRYEALCRALAENPDVARAFACGVVRGARRE